MSQVDIDWSDFSLPITLPELEVLPTAMQIFMFSAATWNRHHIHYSRDAAVAEGLPDIVVQRALIGNFFVRLVTDWLGESGELRQISWKVLNSALPNRKLRCQGVITDHKPQDGSNLLTCELSMLNDMGDTVAVGKATLCIQESSSAR